MKALFAIVLFTVGVAAAAPAATPATKAAVIAAANASFDAGFERTSGVKIAQLTAVQKAAYVAYRSAVATALQKEIPAELFCKQLTELSVSERKALAQAVARTMRAPKVIEAQLSFMATF